MNPTAGRDQSRFSAMIHRVLESNPFYRAKYHRLTSLDRISELPFTTKAELVADQSLHPPFGSNLTFPVDSYTRLHLTSGTTGHPLRWLDTAESWQWWLDCWKEVYRAAGVTRADRIFVAFSFGPFIGFWTAFEAAQQLGALVLAGGGLGTAQRLEMLLDHNATVVVSTPTYALRMMEVARETGLDLSRSAVKTTIHAGEPGASVPSIRQRLEAGWGTGARCVDHAGATEVGAWGFGCGVENNMHVNDEGFLAEVIDPESLQTLPLHGDRTQRGELVLTNLGRVGSPVIRYRTGDLVEASRRLCACGRNGVILAGGVLGRADDMIVVRGINVFPSAIENIVREFDEITEFEVVLNRHQEMTELLIRIEVEPSASDRTGSALSERIHHRLNLRPVVQVVETNSLPRYELKSRRFTRHDRTTL